MGHTIKHFYIFLLFVSTIFAVLEIPPEQDRGNKDIEKSDDQKGDTKNQEIPILQIKTNNEKKDDHNIHVVKTDDKNINGEKVDDKKDKNVPPNGNVTTPKILASNANGGTGTNAEIESGAVMRGIFVFVGITMICIMYIGFKTYFRRNKKSPLIRKYGVKTRRSDIEMEPLPLEEDEEDETVFDLGNVTNR